MGDDVPLYCVVDASHLKQVLINLVGNAVKFTEAGSISVRVETPLELTNGSTTVKFHVDDTGIGIDPELGQSLFDPFQQANLTISDRFGGTGLGLAISHDLIKLMGGQLAYSSTPGKGTSFSFDVLVGRASEPDGVAATAECIVARQDRERVTQVCPTILLVEDNVINQEVVRSYLATLGCTIETANDGLAAIEAVCRVQPDIVLLDCRLPDMSGIEVARILRANEMQDGHPPVPIIAITADAFEDNKVECLKAGMNDFLSKPFAPDELLSIVASNLYALAQHEELRSQ